MRRIGIMVGSDSDLQQCLEGLRFLKSAQNEKLAKVSFVITNSIHKNFSRVVINLLKAVYEVDVLIVGAGWANHLTGICDSFLRYELKNKKIPVIGVAFEDKSDASNTQIAILSITRIPGTQAIFTKSSTGSPFVGEKGFLEACILMLILFQLAGHSFLRFTRLNSEFTGD